MGHNNLWLYFGVEEHPFATYVDVHQNLQGVLTHSHVSVAQNSRARITQVLVFGAMYQGAILVHLFEPQPCGFMFFFP